MATHDLSTQAMESNSPIEAAQNPTQSDEAQVVSHIAKEGRPSIRISTATLPGLIQAYALAQDHILYCPVPDRLQAALEDPATKEEAVFNLQQGALALNILACIQDEDYALAKSYLATLAHDAYKRAENLGRGAV